MRRKIIITLLFVLGIAAGIGYYQYNKPAERTISEDASVSITASEMMKEYEKNETEANRKFLNKVVAVTGMIESITDDSTTVSYSLSTENPVAAISCQVDKSAVSETIAIGNKVRVKGLCTGLLMDVVIVKCSIEKHP